VFIATQHNLRELISNLGFCQRWGRDMSNDRQKLKPTYNVGYGRPPEAHRFKPGRSGNPAGRPRRKQSIDEAIEEALHQPVSVNEKGVRRKLPALQVIMRQLRNSAIRGHLPAAKFLLAPMLQNGKPPDQKTDYLQLSEEELHQLIEKEEKDIRRHEHSAKMDELLEKMLRRVNAGALALRSKPGNSGQR
jgi:hypothetical protein